MGSVFSQRTLKACIPWKAQLRPEEWPDEDQLAADACDALGRMHGCETDRPWGRIVSPRSTCARLVQDISGHLRGWLSGHSRVPSRLLQVAWFQWAKSRQSGGMKGGSTSVPQIVLSFFIEMMRKERKCAAVFFLRTSKRPSTVSLRRLRCVVCCHSTPDRAGLSGQIRQALRDLLAEDAVVMAHGLEPVWSVQRITGTLAARSE